MTITASTAQIASQPVQNGMNALLPTANFPNLLSGGTLTSPAADISSNMLGIVITPITTGGALGASCTLALQAQVNGSQFQVVKTYTNAQIVAGIHDTITIKAKQIQFLFNATGTPANSGVNIRVLD